MSECIKNCLVCMRSECARPPDMDDKGRDEGTIEKCETSDCYFWDDLMEYNCGGETCGETTFATCDRKAKPSYEALARENAELKARIVELEGLRERGMGGMLVLVRKSWELRAALERVVKADDEFGADDGDIFAYWDGMHVAIEKAREFLARKGA